MKAKLWTLFAIVVLCGLAATYDSWHTPAMMAAPADKQIVSADTVPDFSFQTRDGKSYRLKALPENGIVLHFWASWCAPCIAEFPALLEQISHASGRLALVAVSIDDDRSAMDRFIARLGSEGKDSHIYWVWDENKNVSLKIFNTAETPETILVDQSRRMAGKIVGDPGWSDTKQTARLAVLANVKD